MPDLEGENMATNVNMNAQGNAAGGLFNLSGGRGPVGLVVIGIHVVLLYALAASMGVLPAPKLAEPLEAVIIDEPVTKSEPVEVVKPELETPMVETPPIENTIPEIEVPVDEPAPAAITAETSSAAPVGETANMTVSRRVDPVYPPSSRRAGEEGTGHVSRARGRQRPPFAGGSREEQRLPAPRRGGDAGHPQVGVQARHERRSGSAVVDARAGGLQAGKFLSLT